MNQAVPRNHYEAPLVTVWLHEINPEERRSLGCAPEASGQPPFFPAWEKHGPADAGPRRTQHGPGQAHRLLAAAQRCASSPSGFGGKAAGAVTVDIYLFLKYIR